MTLSKEKLDLWEKEVNGFLNSKEEALNHTPFCLFLKNRTIRLIKEARASIRYREALESRSKRSSYHWSTGPLTDYDMQCEGSIECANSILKLVDETLEGKKS